MAQGRGSLISSMKKALSGLWLALFPFSLCALSMEGIVVKDASLSKKSVILDRGELEGIIIGQRAKLYFKNNKKGDNHPEFIYVAEGEAIKVHQNYSFWYLRKIRNFRFIKKGHSLVMLRKLNDPRRAFQVKHTQKVLTNDQSLDDIEELENNGLPSDLIFNEKDYIGGSELVKTIETSSNDLTTEDIDRWKSIGHPEYDEHFAQYRPRFFKAPNDLSPKIASAKKAQERKVFDSTTNGAIEKVNKLKYGLSGLYAESLRDNTSGIRKRSEARSIYDRVKEDKNKEALISPGAVEKIRREGPTFSGNLNDEQLRKFFLNSGIEREMKRQKKALSERQGSEVNLRYFTGLVSNTTEIDPNFQGTDYSLSIGYEYHLGNTSDYLKSLTAEVELELGISHYDLGGINARFGERSARIYVHYYFWNNPDSLDRYMPYVGVGFRRGNSTGFSPEFEVAGNEYAYEILSLPSFRIGVKYRFKSGDTKDEAVKVGVGLNFFIQQETTRITTTDLLVDDIASSLTLNQTKFGFGVGLYF